MQAGESRPLSGIGRRWTALIIADDPGIRDFLAMVIEQEGFILETLSVSGEVGEKFARRYYDLVVVDLSWAEAGGLDIIQKIKRIFPDTFVVAVVGPGLGEFGAAAIKHGADEYVVRPFRVEALRNTVRKAAEAALESLKARALRAKLVEECLSETIIGETPRMKTIYDTLPKIAGSRGTVLICGESGTGKELLVRAIHAYSPRVRMPFVKVNCGALPETLLESELFGHEKGSFTGAVARHIGRFERANKGTMLLDEVSRMSPNIQVKLLRVLQEQEFERVGGNETIRVDVRIIAATNTDLEEAMVQGHFRSDLYYRLNVIPICLPPLRERKGDISILCKHFLTKYSKESGKEVRHISPDCMEVLLTYDWPGNIRELQNWIERAVILAEGDTIQMNHLLRENGFHSRLESPPGVQPLREVERRYIGKILHETGWNLTKSADLLEIDRKTLRAKIRKYRLSPYEGNPGLVGKNSPVDGADFPSNL